ncbi:MAG: peptide chain release factor N(5)-glutamine methyltransferase, partial [Planctomycetota bacterium]
EIPWTIGRLLSWTSDHFGRHQVVDARLASEVLLAHAAQCRRIDLYTRFDSVLEPQRVECFRGWVRRASAHEPIAYLVGQKEFFSLSFKVTPDVLIPRAETETLVECVLDHCGKAGLTHPRLLDLGTGTGCLAIAALVHLPVATGVATDVSAAALEVARSNAARHGVTDRLTLIEADRLALPAEVVPQSGFDILMCNPPYIPASAIAGLDAAVRDYEPSLALTDGAEGLSFYRTIAADGPALLAPDAMVFVEIGDGQAQAVVEVMTAVGNLEHRQTRKDRIVGQERVLAFSIKRAAGFSRRGPSSASMAPEDRKVARAPGAPGFYSARGSEQGG